MKLKRLFQLLDGDFDLVLETDLLSNVAVPKTYTHLGLWTGPVLPVRHYTKEEISVLEKEMRENGRL